MPSKLDPFADEIIALRENGEGFRAIANFLKERRDTPVHHATVAAWYKARTSLTTRQALQRGDAKLLVTRELIETEWAKQIQEFYGNYDAARKQGQRAEAEYRRAVEAEDAEAQERWDLERHTGPAMAVWGRLWVDAVKTVASKLVPSPTPVRLAAETEGEMTAEEFWEKIRAERT